MKKTFWLILVALSIEVFIAIIILNSSRHDRNFLYSIIVRKKHIALVVGVISAPMLADRRHAVRNTWFKFCQQHHEVVCKFFLDSLDDMDQNVRQAIVKENAMYNDIEYIPVPPGVNFGRRILWLLEWSAKNFVFDFLLRVDDDVFVCLQRLLYELRYRQEKRLYWGFIHCTKDRVRVDEEFLLLSHDLVHEFLRKRDSLLCNPFGDISVALWVNSVPDVTYIHDKRIYHDARADEQQLFKDTNLCHKFLAINSAYKTQTLRYWINVQHEKNTDFKVLRVEPFNRVCNQSKLLKWKAFALGHRFEPVRCVRKPTWNLLGHIYLGRKGEEEKRKKIKLRIKQQREKALSTLSIN